MAPAAPDLPEQQARRHIDALLEASGWQVQSRAQMNLGAGPGVAIRELPTAAGPADYALFLGNQWVGVIEAKRVGTTLAGVEPQTRAYATQTPAQLQVPVRPLPFLYESTGVETFFTNGLDPEARGRRVFSFHRPETLRTWLDAEVHRRQGRPGAPPAPTIKGRMRAAPAPNTAGMWPAQISALENLEASVRAGRPRALIQMATGAGKTFTAISAIYRLVSQGGARRVLFLVDRSNLGRQALKEFQAYTTPDDGRKFTELYNAVFLKSNKLPEDRAEVENASKTPATKVIITTIQRLYSILRGDETFDEGLEEGSSFDGHGAALVREPPPVVYSPKVPPEYFDVVVIDECHRSIYSLWRQVLEYFDASLVGLTATPAKQTYAFFYGNVVSEYRHEQAVRDRVNVPFTVYEIRTEVTEKGAKVEAGPFAFVKKRDRATRAERWERLDEDLSYDSGQLDRSVIVPEQIRTVVNTFKERLFTEIFPGRTEIPKTLIFAKSDDHAEDIVRILRDTWPLPNEAVVKITYKAEATSDVAKKKGASHKPEELIQSFRTGYHPRIAVTVDMIATGTDIKPLECLLFMRSVKSRALFEQMKGRGVRVVADAALRTVTPDAHTKTHFVLVDCVGVVEDTHTDPPLDRERGIAFDKLLELVRLGNRDDDILSSLAARLDRMDRRLTSVQRELLSGACPGVTLRDVVAGLLDSLDPDREDARAREIFGLPPEATPSAQQVQVAQQELREAAAVPLAHNPKLCEAILEVRKAQEVTVDVITTDTLLRAGARPDQAPSYDADKALVSDFEAFCRDHRDALDALTVLFNRPYAQRLTRKQLLDLVAAIRRPPRQWTTEELWAAYERLEQGRVRGASKGRLMTDLISLTRHALGVEPELVSYRDQAEARFQNWLAQQGNRGRRFTDEQRQWLELIRDRIAVDLEVRMEDFDETPFAEQGGLGKAWGLFGETIEGLVDELNRELVA